MYMLGVLCLLSAAVALPVDQKLPISSPPAKLNAGGKSAAAEPTVLPSGLSVPNKGQLHTEEPKKLLEAAEKPKQEKDEDTPDDVKAVIQKELQKHKESGESKEPNAAEELKEPKASEELKEPKASEELKEPKASGEWKEPNASGEEPKESGELKEPKASGESKGPKASDEFKEPKWSEEIKEPKSSGEFIISQGSDKRPSAFASFLSHLWPFHWPFFNRFRDADQNQSEPTIYMIKDTNLDY